MATFKIKCSKDKSQQTITVRQTDNTDLSGTAAIVISVYSDDLTTADSTYALTSGERTTFLADGTVDLTASDVLGADPSDDFYSLEMSCDSDTFLSNKAGVAITLEAQGEVYNHQGSVDVYAPDYRIDKVLHTAHMLVSEMDAIENIDTDFQKRVDFTTRLATLKKILNY